VGEREGKSESEEDEDEDEDGDGDGDGKSERWERCSKRAPRCRRDQVQLRFTLAGMAVVKRRTRRGGMTCLTEGCGDGRRTDNDGGMGAASRFYKRATCIAVPPGAWVARGSGRSSHGVGRSRRMGRRGGAGLGREGQLWMCKEKGGRSWRKQRTRMLTSMALG
jgi:hypothetical protein